MTAEERAAQDAAWAQHNLSQLRYFRALSLRARLEAVEGMAASRRKRDASLFRRERAAWK